LDGVADSTGLIGMLNSQASRQHHEIVVEHSDICCRLLTWIAMRSDFDEVPEEEKLLQDSGNGKLQRCCEISPNAEGRRCG
jgi:hypothetical protein